MSPGGLTSGAFGFAALLSWPPPVEAPQPPAASASTAAPTAGAMRGRMRPPRTLNVMSAHRSMLGSALHPHQVNARSKLVGSRAVGDTVGIRAAFRDPARRGRRGDRLRPRTRP